jgi:NADH-quinone oxidoreductase subunit C
MADKGFADGLRDLDEGPESTGADTGPPAGPEPAASHPSVVALRQRFPDGVLHHAVMAGDEHVVYIPSADVREMLGWLKNEPAQRYDFLADLTAVDYGGGRPLEVVYQLWSIEHKRALRVKATLPLEALEIDSVQSLWNTANWLEREVFDLFGIHFHGHPDLRRILMPEQYAEGHPLRKDFPLRGRFSRAEQTRRALAMATEDYYTPEELRIAEDAYGERVPEPAPAPTEDLRKAAATATAAAQHAAHPRKADEWALGAPDTGASGAPGPSAVTE